MINLIKREYGHFRLLPDKAKNMIISYMFYCLSYPVFMSFVNAYIWKNKGDLADLLYYRIGHFAIIYIVFIFNGLLLRSINVKWLYLFGSLVLGISMVLVTLINQSSPVSYIVTGVIFGSGVGFFWANRNYLVIKSTSREIRNYFFGLSTTINVIFSFLVSVIVGWSLVFGLSYQLLMIVAFIFLLISGLLVLKVNHKSPAIKNLMINKLTTLWSFKRFTSLGIGLIEGLGYFVPSILILKYLGNEGVLGTLTALASLVSAILLYYFARKSKSVHNRTIFISVIVFGFLVSGFLAIFFEKFTIIMYVLFSNFILGFIWASFSPVLYNGIENEAKGNESIKYGYVTDNEFFLNSGRLITAFTTLFILNKWGDGIALRYAPILLYLTSVIVFGLVNLYQKRFLKQLTTSV